MARVTTPLAVKLDDTAADRVRVSHARAISELQDTTEELSTGRKIGEQILTGSGNYTPTPGTRAVVIWGIGQGGGGGGAADGGAGTGVAAGSGGNSGTVLRIRVVSPNGQDIAGGPYVGGSSGGQGGSTAGSNGTAGANSTLSVAGRILVAGGGGAGVGISTITGNGNLLPSAQPGGTSAGITHYGRGGESEMLGSAWFSGGGGTTWMGSGGSPVGGSNAGGAGNGGGGGSGGATSGGSGGKVGGNGGAGYWFVEEYA